MKREEFITTDITSSKQVMEVLAKQWIWVDIYKPDEEENEIILEILGNEVAVANQLKNRALTPLNKHKGCILCSYEKVQEWIFLTVPFIRLDEQIRSYPNALAKKNGMLITWGEEDYTQSELIKLTIRRLRELVEEGEKPNSGLVISIFLREIAINTSKVLMSVREKIDDIEEQALEDGGKQLIPSIFSLKKLISNLYRLIINEKQFMLDMETKIIPHIKLDEKTKLIADEAKEIIDWEMNFMDSYTRSLDSVLTLQDLASIHRVESSINFLTIVLVISTVILVALEILGILGVV